MLFAPGTKCTAGSSCPVPPSDATLISPHGVGGVVHVRRYRWQDAGRHILITIDLSHLWPSQPQQRSQNAAAPDSVGAPATSCCVTEEGGVLLEVRRGGCSEDAVSPFTASTSASCAVHVLTVRRAFAPLDATSSRCDIVAGGTQLQVGGCLMLGNAC